MRPSEVGLVECRGMVAVVVVGDSDRGGRSLSAPPSCQTPLYLNRESAAYGPDPTCFVLPRFLRALEMSDDVMLHDRRRDLDVQSGRIKAPSRLYGLGGLGGLDRLDGGNVVLHLYTRHTRTSRPTLCPLGLVRCSSYGVDIT